MKELLARERLLIDGALDRLLPPADAWPSILHQAMRYAVLGGGKRIRPILARAAHRAAGGDPDFIIEAAAALEMIHTYSLVHDDLPAMDDDVLRRGRETVHVAFDEATAILVGDALLTEGLLVLARHPVGQANAVMRGQASQIVAEAVSSRGMVGGQMEDLEAEQQPDTDDPARISHQLSSRGRGGAVPSGDFDLRGAESYSAVRRAHRCEKTPLGAVHRRPQQEVGGKCGLESRLELIHRHKTGCLLQASVEIGAVLAGVNVEQLGSFSRYGHCLGLAFQVADDILDATASAAELGKSPGKDETAGKLTYVTLYGLDSARTRLTRLETEMVDLAKSLEGDDTVLGDLARFVARRTS